MKKLNDAVKTGASSNRNWLGMMASGLPQGLRRRLTHQLLRLAVLLANRGSHSLMILCRDLRRQSHQLIVPFFNFCRIVRRLKTVNDQFFAVCFGNWSTGWILPRFNVARINSAPF
jgi:hypothetical protein